MKYVIFGILGLMALFLITATCSWIGETTSVVREEFGPRAALAKYEWFIDASNAIDAKKRDVSNYRLALEITKADMSPRERDEREALRLRESELLGMITTLNALIAEYNAASAKFNWRPFESRSDRPATTYEEYK